jgi:hypothetical protein
MSGIVANATVIFFGFVINGTMILGGENIGGEFFEPAVPSAIIDKLPVHS